jgi:oligopeptide/dipeptide ABC transporter ATP-binding protein
MVGMIQSSMDTDKIIEVEDLVVRFRAREQRFGLSFRGNRPKWLNAVDRASFSIKSGETFGLVGETGSGKSTIAKVLVGLYEPSSGKVKLLGREINFHKKSDIFFLRQNVGIVFQDPVGSLNPRLTVRDIIAEALIASHIPDRDTYNERIYAIMEKVGLRHSSFSAHPRELSGGEKQRVSLARALVVPKRLLILDEPTSSLDMTIQAQVLNTIRKVKSDLDLSFLFITHDLSVIRYMSTRLAVLFYGKIMEVGNAADVLKSPKHPYSGELLSNLPQIKERRKIVPDGGNEVLVEHQPASDGCIYRNVCSKVFEKCSSEPALREIEPGHSVSCFLYHDEIAPLSIANK